MLLDKLACDFEPDPAVGACDECCLVVFIFVLLRVPMDPDSRSDPGPSSCHALARSAAITVRPRSPNSPVMVKTILVTFHAPSSRTRSQ